MILNLTNIFLLKLVGFESTHFDESQEAGFVSSTLLREVSLVYVPWSMVP